ncbi:MAG: response regulator transcription factor [Ktedonobacteraceae bacterium]|nr:response regulator transcription factor [Ktedonobacteraceae bacterium]MBO0795577.1 response regulator transcription factor [Ktedonobacteraceae bacterium]
MKTTYSEGYLRLYLNEGDELADVLRELLTTLHEKELRAYGRRILSAFAVKSGTSVQGTTIGTPFLLAPLSPQERKVLRLLASGNSNAEIARELVVSVNTVRTQIRSIYRKLNVDNRVEASAAARQLEML